MSGDMSEFRNASLLLPVAQPTEGAAGKTGTWRVFKPLHDRVKCTRCLLCWVFCPEGCVKRHLNDDIEFDLEYCKGCGICARECRVNAVTMQREEA